jgi:hypothetical protein
VEERKNGGSGLERPLFHSSTHPLAFDAAFRLLFPLDEFYAHDRRPLPPVTRLPGDEVPHPYQELLVHDRDMTPTLEAFHGDRIHLRVLDRRLEEHALWRQVALVLNGSERPVEFGAIVIYCDRFPPAAREVIRECSRPLGTILADYRVQHESCPQAFLCVASDAFINEALGLQDNRTLYGRRNVLFAPGGVPLAEILEILPPIEGEGEAEMRAARYR